MLKKVKLTPQPKWTTVFQTRDELLLRIIKLRLEDEEIPVMIFDQRDSSYTTFGDVYIQVPFELEQKALNLINQE